MVKDFLTNYFERSLLAVLVLGAFILMGWLISLFIRHLGKKKTMQKNRAYRLIAGSINTLKVIVGAISALGTLGVNITALVAGLGLTGFALGLALKEAISNFIAGLLIVIYAPFEIDDITELTGFKGKVIDINLRYVTLKTESEIVLGGQIKKGTLMKNITFIFPYFTLLAAENKACTHQFAYQAL